MSNDTNGSGASLEDMVPIGQWSIANRIDQKTLYGLCAMQGLVKGGESLARAFLDVRCGNQQSRLPLSEVMTTGADGSRLLTFHVNSHLIANGTQELTISLVRPNGSLIAWPEMRVIVDNTSELAQSVSRKLAAFGTPPFLGRQVDTKYYPYRSAPGQPWFDSDPLVGAPPLSMEPAPDEDAARRHMQSWGFCVLNSTLPPQLLEAMRVEIDAAITSGRLHHKEGSSERIHGAHRLPVGRQIWLYPPVLKFLRDWFRDEPAACQTLLFVNGSEQSAHQDTIHLTPYPSGYMCGVWIALEDVTPGSGELFVFPGSHRTPRVTAGSLGLEKVTSDYSSYWVFSKRIEELLAQGGYERLAYCPRAGHILVWHENLIHGGSPRVQRDVTRRSIVSHYFARGSVAFYDSRGEAATLEPVQ